MRRNDNLNPSIFVMSFGPIALTFRPNAMITARKNWRHLMYKKTDKTKHVTKKE